MQTPARLVTIVIPTHDRPRLLDEAVASAKAAAVHASSFGDIEILVVDNSSTPELTAEAKRVADKHGARFTQSGNGPSVARNAGVAASNSEFIAFLDDDDLYLPEHLTTLLPVFAAHPTCALAFGQLRMCDEHMVPWNEEGVPHGPLPSGEAFAYCVGTILQCNTIVVRRSVFDDVGGFDEEHQRTEDWDLLMRIAAQHDIFGVEVVVSHLRQHHGPRSLNQISFADWRRYERVAKQIKRRALRLPARVPLSFRQRWFGGFRMRGQGAYHALCHAQDSMRAGNIADARLFVLGAFGRSAPHALRLAPQFRRDLLAIALGRSGSPTNDRASTV